MKQPAQPLTLDLALTRYRDTFLASRNLAPRTRVEYLTDLTDLIRFLHDCCQVSTAQAVTRSHLEDYLAELDRRGLTGNTRRRKVASLRSFFGHLEDAGLRVGGPHPPAHLSRAGAPPAPLPHRSWRRSGTNPATPRSLNCCCKPACGCPNWPG